MQVECKQAFHERPCLLGTKHPPTWAAWAAAGWVRALAPPTHLCSSQAFSLGEGVRFAKEPNKSRLLLRAGFLEETYGVKDE